MTRPPAVVSIGTRNYVTLLAAVVATLACMALPPPLDATATIGLSLVIVVQIRLLMGQNAGVLWSWLFRLLGWLALASLWLWLLTPPGLRSSGIPLLVMLLLFEVEAYHRLVRRLSQERRVTEDVLTGALAGYMLLGITAALVTALVESIAPGSFHGLGSTAPADPAASGDTSLQQVQFIHLAYFAFVTLTTLGYGDVLPITPLAKLSVIGISVLGPFYLAVIMGVLIGRYIQQAPDEP
jgi:hypothetical protein